MSKTRVVDTRDWVSHIARARPSPPSSLPRYFIPAIIIIIITLRSVGIPHTRMIAPVRRLCTKTVRTCPPVRRISMIGRDNNKIPRKSLRKSNFRNDRIISIYWNVTTRISTIIGDRYINILSSARKKPVNENIQKRSKIFYLSNKKRI